MVSIPQQNLTTTAWQLPHWRNRGKENQSWSVPSLAEQTHQIQVQATSKTVWKGTCWCYRQHPYLCLVEIPSAGIFTQEPSCVACKTEGWWKEKVSVPTSSKILNYSAKRWKRPANTSALLICHVFYYFDLSRFKQSTHGDLANCHKRSFCRGIFLFLRNSFPTCCWVFQILFL